MSEPEESPFFLPIHLTGLDHPEMMMRGMAIGSLALLTAAAVTVAAQVLGPFPVSVWQLLADAAFLLVRTPRTAHAAWLQMQASEWGYLLWLAGLLCFAWFASGRLAKASEMMARNLSLGDDDYKFNKKDSKRAVLVPRYLFVLFLLGGGALWIHLNREGDSHVLRLVRLISIGLFVQLGTLLAGGAMACGLAEGRHGLDALGRMLGLAWRKRDDFVRALVYTLPRWYGLSFMSWCVVFAGIVLPLLLGGTLMGLYLSFLRGHGSWQLRAIPVAFGLCVVVGWIVLMRGLDQVVRVPVGQSRVAVVQIRWRGLRGPWMRFIAMGGLLASAWGLLVLPLAPGAQLDRMPLWLDAGFDYVAGRSSASLPAAVETGLLLVALVSLLLVTSFAGRFLFLFPLAAGTCAFFTLRHADENKNYRRSSGLTRVTAQTSPATVVTNIFAPSGETSLDVKPPRGWRPLAYLTLRPVPLLLSCSVAAVFVALLLARVSGPMLGVVTAAVLVACLPLLCRHIAFILVGEKEALRCDCSSCAGWRHSSLVREPEAIVRSAGQMAVVVAGAWLYMLLISSLVVAAIGVGGSLGLIPWVGPVLWSVFFVPMLIGAARVASLLIHSIPGSLLLLPVAAVACDDNWLARAQDVREQMRHYASVCWTFLGAVAAGLPFAMLPALVFAAAMSLLRGWSALGAWSAATMVLAVGLALLGMATAITNALLAIRKLVETREEAKALRQAQPAPLRIGDTVVLGRHWPMNGKDNWDPLMDQYVGKKARVTALPGKDDADCDVVRCDVDGGRFAWRIQDLTRM